MGWPIFGVAMSACERQRRRRARLRGELAPWQPKPKKLAPQFAPDSPLLQALSSIDDMQLPNLVLLDDGEVAAVITLTSGGASIPCQAERGTNRFGK